MNIVYRCALLLPTLVCLVGGSRAQQSPHSGSLQSAAIEIGKSPFVFAGTGICGPLASTCPFDPKTYGQVRGYNPLGAKPPVVVYTRVLNADFFRLAAMLEAKVAGDAKWTNLEVIVTDEKGAQRGGYSVEELTRRREAIRQQVESNHLPHLSFFLSAPNAKYMTERLQLLGRQDMLLAVLAPSKANPQNAVVKTAARLSSRELAPQKCRETVEAITPVVEGI